MQSDITELSLQDQFLTWFEKNKQTVAWGALALALLGAAAGIYFYRQNQVQAEAGEALSKITAAGMTGGTTAGSTEAMLKVVSDYPNTDAARQSLLLAAGNLFAEGKYKEAQTQFDRFLREYRESSFAGQALLGVAACKDAQSLTNDAIAAYKDIVDHHSSESVVPQARFALGRLYESQGKLELARDAYQQVAQIDPNGALGSEAQMRLAELFSQNPALIPARATPTGTPTLTIPKS